MTLLLDTSIIVGIERRDKNTIEKLKILSHIHPLPAEISFMTYYEFLTCIQKKTPKNKEESIEFLNKFTVLQTTKKTAEILSDLKYKYTIKGIQLSLTDLMIASTSIEHNLTLVTKDKDFEKIEELKKIIL